MVPRLVGAFSDGQVEESAPVGRLDVRRSVPHDVEEEVVHAGLIEDQVRELREAILGVLDPATADDVLAALLVRLPERRLVDPVRLPQDPLAEAERLEHLDRAARDAVRLSENQWPRLLVDDAGRDVGEGGELCGERQSGRAAADDQHVDNFRQRVVEGRRAAKLRTLDPRIPRPEPVQMELHRRTCPARVMGVVPWRAIEGADVRRLPAAAGRRACTRSRVVARPRAS